MRGGGGGRQGNATTGHQRPPQRDRVSGQIQNAPPAYNWEAQAFRAPFLSLIFLFCKMQTLTRGDAAMKLNGPKHKKVPSRAFGTKIMNSSSGRHYCLLPVNSYTCAPSLPVPPRRRVQGVLPRCSEGAGRGSAGGGRKTTAVTHTGVTCGLS